MFRAALSSESEVKMNTDPQHAGSSEPETPVVEDAAVKAAMDAYSEAAAQPEMPAQPEAPAAESTPPASEPQPGLEELTAALEAMRSQADEHREQFLRARAELENIRRRHAAELEKTHKFALDGFVRELLQVRDSLELGHSAAQDESADVTKLREGTELTLKLLGDVMEKFGVALIDPLDQPFDPAFHQAISTQPRVDVPPNTVVGVIQKGYTLNGRLVRPALVLVSQQGA